jgi:hypothetical protein
MRMRIWRIGLFLSGLSALCLAAGLSAAAATAITGVCPDGSVFIVRTVQQIPCPRAKQVDPSDVPPLRPHYLPSPYTWQVWKEAQDPNNPYNLIDAARQIRGLDGASGGARESLATPPVADTSEAPAPVAADRTWSGPLDLGLSDDELRSLFLIVELAQERAPAQFARDSADGRGILRVALAHSAAFEERLRAAWASRGGLGGSRVLLFTVLSKRPEPFHPNFTFVQRHLSYQPDAGNARQLGVLQGRLGALEADEVVLGYVVLPDAIDLVEEMDVYWNDRRTTVHFGG